MRVDDRLGVGGAGRPEPLPAPGTEPGPAPGTEPGTQPGTGDRAAWRRALVVGTVAFLVSRVIVVVGAGIVAAARQPKPTSAARPILEVLTSWDGLWYLELVRRGYPRVVPDHVTFFQLEARAAFFPLYPTLVRWVDQVLPGGDTVAALTLNFVLGALFVLVVGLLTRDLFGPVTAGRAMVLMSLFPGSFVLSFAYSEAVMLVLVALSLLALHRRHWVWAGLLAALAGTARPNAVALVAAAAVASFLAIRRRRDWASLAAPLLAPLGFVAHMLFLWHHTGERSVWFRVQREAWNEGLSFGLTVLRRVGEFGAHPFTSAVNAITAASVIALVIGLVALWKARLPAPIVVYTLVVVGLMLATATVTARPRFLFTAFPLVIALAAVWPDEDREWWGMLLAACGAGLLGLVVTYGLFAAIP